MRLFVSGRGSVTLLYGGRGPHAWLAGPTAITVPQDAGSGTAAKTLGNFSRGSAVCQMRTCERKPVGLYCDPTLSSGMK